MKWLVMVVVAAQSLQMVLSAKILALCCVASHSHSLWCYKYMALLSERGHEITVLGVDEPNIKISNLTTYIIGSQVYNALTTMDLSFTQWINIGSKIGSMIHFKHWSETSSKEILHSNVLKDFMKQYKNIDKPFDLIIHDNGGAEALLGLVPLFGNPPLVLATTFGCPQWMLSRAGNILNPAYVPTMKSSSDQHMTFLERCQNTISYVFLEWFTEYIFDPFQDKLMKEVFGDHLPHVRDIAKQANVVIVNHHFALNNPIPVLPGVIGIAGLHISEPNALPQDIKTFMDEAEHGVILLSFGTNFDSKWLPRGLEEIVLETMKSLPQRVLWKWDKDIPNLPPNVKISNWLPQSDMLVHPNMRLFITHCGLLSIQEAVFHKVPVLVLPFVLDQIENADIMVRRSLTIKLNIHKLTVNELRKGIKEILSNPIYKRNIEKMGELMADMPQTAKQQAVFWTEYAIRHQGAAHLHSTAADMPWHQLLLLDVLGFVLLLLILFVWIIKAILSFVFIKLRFSNPKNKTD